MSFTDLKQSYSLMVEDGVLTVSTKLPANPDVVVALSKPSLDAVAMGDATPDQSISSGTWQVAGKREVVMQFIGLLDTFTFCFNIVTP